MSSSMVEKWCLVQFYESPEWRIAMVWQNEVFTQLKGWTWRERTPLLRWLGEGSGVKTQRRSCGGLRANNTQPRMPSILSCQRLIRNKEQSPFWRSPYSLEILLFFFFFFGWLTFSPKLSTTMLHPSSGRMAQCWATHFPRPPQSSGGEDAIVDSVRLLSWRAANAAAKNF